MYTLCINLKLMWSLSQISGAMAWFWLAIVAFPEVQKKAQAELDEVVGRHRLPTFADYDRLPYIRAICKESLRWKTVDPLGEFLLWLWVSFTLRLYCAIYRCASSGYGGQRLSSLSSNAEILT